MSGGILQYPDPINAPPPEVQVWNNAAFENSGESDSAVVMKPSWLSQSLETTCSSKENLSPPVFEKSSVSVSSLLPIKPLQSNTLIANSQEPHFKIVTKDVKTSKDVNTSVEEGGGKNRDGKKIDMEIEAIEKEIVRLKSRLEALRLQKIEMNLRSIERRGKPVAAKFMEQKPGYKIEGTLPRTKLNRRGMSLGPGEIFSGAKMGLLSNQDMTPVSTQSRRKSCFWKLEEIDELKATKERGKSQSLSPRSRKTVSKIQAPKQAVTTVGSKRPIKKQDGVLLASIQPKNLFKDGEKSVSKKTAKPGRVVASRYSQIGVTSNQSNGGFPASEPRKRSWPENGKEDGNKRRVSRGTGTSQRMEGNKVKKRWEIPSEVVIFKADSVEETPPSVSAMGDGLPKIRTLRFVDQTPRDSGAAKRVADLVGKKSYFSNDDGKEEEEVETGDSVFQALSFEEGDVGDM